MVFSTLFYFQPYFILNLSRKNQFNRKPYYLIYKAMKVEYNNLYTHFVFTTFRREPLILNKNRERIEKYITGIVNNNGCQLYAIYANPEHVHFLVSRSPGMDEETLASIVANSSANFINENKLCKCNFQWQMSCSAFLFQKRRLTMFANTY